MKFEVGDKVRFKTKEEDWEEVDYIFFNLSLSEVIEWAKVLEYRYGKCVTITHSSETRNEIQFKTMGGGNNEFYYMHTKCVVKYEEKEGE